MTERWVRIVTDTVLKAQATWPPRILAIYHRAETFGGSFNSVKDVLSRADDSRFRIACEGSRARQRRRHLSRTRAGSPREDAAHDPELLAATMVVANSEATARALRAHRRPKRLRVVPNRSHGVDGCCRRPLAQ